MAATLQADMARRRRANPGPAASRVRDAGEDRQRDHRAQASQHANQTLADINRLVAQSEELARSRIDTEAQWTQQHGERMDQLAGQLRTELGALRDDEAARGHAAVERLDELQAALATHLATLGSALEAPMTRLMQTAAEVPQAAAGVLTQLREEMSRITARDTLALEERSAVMDKINALLQTLHQSAGEQRAAIESLATAAATVMDQASQQFADTLGAQAGRSEAVAAQVVGSAVELSSLGESFNHGVLLFNTTNEKLIDSLQRIEDTLGRSIARSDEQLAYYVAQAREVIDLSISSQQGVMEDLRRLHRRQPALAEGVAEGSPDDRPERSRRRHGADRAGLGRLRRPDVGPAGRLRADPGRRAGGADGPDGQPGIRSRQAPRGRAAPHGAGKSPGHPAGHRAASRWPTGASASAAACCSP